MVVDIVISARFMKNVSIVHTVGGCSTPTVLDF